MNEPWPPQPRQRELRAARVGPLWRDSAQNAAQIPETLPRARRTTRPLANPPRPPHSPPEPAPHHVPRAASNGAAFRAPRPVPLRTDGPPWPRLLHAPRRRVSGETAVRGAGRTKEATSSGRLRGTSRRGRYRPVPGRWAEEGKARHGPEPRPRAQAPALVPTTGDRRRAPGDGASQGRPAAVPRREPQPSAGPKTAAPRSPAGFPLFSQLPNSFFLVTLA